MINLRKTRPGVSLLIGVGLTTIIVLFATIVANTTISSTRQSANVNRATEAYYAAEGALEQGLMANKGAGIGFTGPKEEVNFGDTVRATATYEVVGKVPETSAYADPSDYKDMYGVPIPGSGNVGKNCDPLKAFKDENFIYDAATAKYTQDANGYDAADHPCNWNRIAVGQTVAIPLYVNDPIACPDDQDGICNPKDMELKQVLLRVRTPCVDGAAEMCGADQRFELAGDFGAKDILCDEDTNGNIGCGDTIMTWSISGGSVDGLEKYELKPLAWPEYKHELFLTRAPFSSEIYEYLINNVRSETGTLEPLYDAELNCGMFCVFSQQKRYGQDEQLPPVLGLVSDFLLNNMDFMRDMGKEIHKPIFRFSVINSLVSTLDQGSIPYLEYQVLTDVGTDFQPTAEAQTIRAEGFSGEFKQVLEVKQPQESGLLEYVIQQ